MKYSIIIPTYNHLEDFLKPCIESIIKYTDLTDGEVIIVANGCKDGTREYIESLGSPFKLVWFDEGIGYTRATNEGVKVSCGEKIILMNNDFLLLPQEKNTWLNYLLNPLKDNIGMVCNLKIWDESTERMFGVFFCVATLRRLWDKIGGLDESWSPGGCEDIEFCIKLEQLGYKIIQVPDEHNEIINGINVNRFPSWHRGEGTVLSPEFKESWKKHMAESRERLKEKYRLPRGWFYGADIEEYRRLVEDVPMGGTIGELGCAAGRSICSVADIIKRKRLKVIIVDTFEGTVGERKPGEGPDDFFDEFVDNIKRFGILKQCEIYKGTTNETVEFIEDETFDLLFIDADHAYEAIHKDLENWERTIKKGGTISGHDYGNWEGVGIAVNEKWDNVRVYGSVWSKRL